MCWEAACWEAGCWGVIRVLGWDLAEVRWGAGLGTHVVGRQERSNCVRRLAGTHG